MWYIRNDIHPSHRYINRAQHEAPFFFSYSSGQSSINESAKIVHWKRRKASACVFIISFSLFVKWQIWKNKEKEKFAFNSGQEYDNVDDYIAKTDVCRFYQRQLLALLVSPPLLLLLLLLLLQPPWKSVYYIYMRKKANRQSRNRQSNKPEQTKNIYMPAH